MLAIKQQHGITHKDVKRIRLASYKAGLDIIDNGTPEGEYQAKFSIQYTVAHALVHGSVRLNAFLADRMNDPDVRALMKKIEVVADPELSKGYPVQRAAQIEVETNDGRTLRHFQPTRKGDPEMPLTDEELERQIPRACDARNRRNARTLAPAGVVAHRAAPVARFRCSTTRGTRIGNADRTVRCAAWLIHEAAQLARFTSAFFSAPGGPRAAASPPRPTRPVRSGSSFLSLLAAVTTSSRGSSRCVSGQGLGQQVIVDNRGGAGGTIGTDMTAKSSPDGYTILVNNISLAVNHTLFTRLPYDTLKDLAPVSLIGRQPNIVVVNPSLPVKNVRELLTLARSEPGGSTMVRAAWGRHRTLRPRC